MKPIIIRWGSAIFVILLLFIIINIPEVAANSVLTGMFYRDSFSKNLPILIDCYQENIYLLEVDDLESDSYLRIDGAYVEPLDTPIETDYGTVEYRIVSWNRISEIDGCFDRGFKDDVYESDPLITGYLDWGEFTDTIPILQNCDDGTLYYFHPPGYGRNYFNIYDAIVRPLEPPEELGIGTISYMIESFSSIEPISYVKNCGRSIQTDPQTEPSATQTQSQQISGNDQQITIPPTSTPQTPTSTESNIQYGPHPNDGYETGPRGTGLLERIIQIFIPPVEASFTPAECQNKFDEGQCTWFVAGLRPDVCNWITPGMGMAYQWNDQARQNGGPYNVSVHSSPQTGDIVVWEPGCAEATGAGHVAIVTSIDSNKNTFRVREGNWNRFDPDIKVEGCLSFISSPQSGSTAATLTDSPPASEIKSDTSKEVIASPEPVIKPTPSGQPSSIFEWILDLFR